MSELYRQSPLNTSNGGEAPVAIELAELRVREKPFIPKRLLQGDPTLLATALYNSDVASLPKVPNTYIEGSNGLLCLWFRPRQWLLLAEQNTSLQAQAELQAQLVESGTYVIDVTDKYHCFTISGARASELLAVGCSLNLRKEKFTPGLCAQTLIEQVPVIVCRRPQGYTVLVERALANHLWLWFCHASREFE